MAKLEPEEFYMVFREIETPGPYRCKVFCESSVAKKGVVGISHIAPPLSGDLIGVAAPITEIAIEVEALRALSKRTEKNEPRLWAYAFARSDPTVAWISPQVELEPVGLASLHLRHEEATSSISKPRFLEDHPDPDAEGPVERAISRYLDSRDQSLLRSVFEELLANEFVVPIKGGLQHDSHGRAHASITCVGLKDGRKCVPMYTSKDRLLQLELKGSDCVTAPGLDIFDMVTRMSGIDWIGINCSCRPGIPYMMVHRNTFELLARGKLPVD